MYKYKFFCSWRISIFCLKAILNAFWGDQHFGVNCCGPVHACQVEYLVVEKQQLDCFMPCYTKVSPLLLSKFIRQTVLLVLFTNTWKSLASCVGYVSMGFYLCERV